jgi:2-polyprenyl-6-hydroxyphenyl methylase/3-demethylubiquinone-9 3-methyltransferase
LTLLARWREPPPARRNDAAVYNRRADAWWSTGDPYFASLRAMVRPRLSFFARHALLPAGARVLDVGAGGGLLAVELAARGARVVALDLAPRALQAARAEAGRRRLALAAVVADGERAPLREASFDLVVCADVLPHVVDQPPLLDELARLVAPGGKLYVATMNRTALARFVLITLGEDVLGLIPRGTHVAETFVTPAELAREMAARGLTRAVLEGVGPVGFDRKGLLFGRVPLQAVMYQALFTKAGSGEVS